MEVDTPLSQPSAMLSHLGSSIFVGLGTRLGDNVTFRKYASDIATQVWMAGRNDNRMSTVVYECGRRHANTAAALAITNAQTVRINSYFPLDTVASELATSLGKRYSNFGANFEAANLAGVVCRLAKALAAWSLYDGVSTADVRGGQALRVYALNSLFTPFAAHQSMVFIPRVVETLVAPDVFSVLASAVSGEGGSVATDALEVDNALGTPIVHEVTGAAFPRACVNALRLLGANFGAASSGDQFAYALTKGIHSVITVVGHTDEGGYIRDVLRRNEFSIPFGPILSDVTAYVGLPALGGSSIAAVSSYVDAIALKTAGLVAHCDPGNEYNGAWFPSFFLGTDDDEDAIVLPGNETAPRDGMAISLKESIASDFSRFAMIYIPALTKLFGFPEAHGKSVGYMCSGASMIEDNCRHLRFPSVCPYFWVEPTSLIPHDFVGSPAELNGFAAYATVNRERPLDGFEYIETKSTVQQSFSEHTIQFRAPRACPLLVHLHGHWRDGLGSITPIGMDTGLVLHPGNLAGNPVLRDRLDAGVPISSYLWVRGQSPFPAPGELLNLGLSMSIRVNHFGTDNRGRVTPNHTPLAGEMSSTKVLFNVSLPRGIANGAQNNLGAEVRRSRCRAAEELAATIERIRVFGTTTVLAMPVSHSAPPLGSRNGPPPRADRPFSGGGQGHREQVNDPAVFPQPILNAPTAQLPATTHHGTHTGPQVRRQGGGGGGGGPGNPPRPNNPPGDAPPADLDGPEGEGALPVPPPGPLGVGGGL